MQNKIIYKHLIICISFFLFSLHVFSQIDKKAFKIVQIDSTENYYIIFLSLSPNSVEINNIPFLLNKGNNHYDVINYNRGFIYCLLSPKIKTFSKNIYTNKVIELSLKCSSNETMTESYMHIGYGDYLLQYPNDKLYFSEQILDLLYTQNLDSIKYFSLIRYQNEFFDMNMLYIWMNFSKTKLSYSKWLNDQIKKAKQYNIKNYSTPIFLYSDMDCQTPYEKTQSISFIDGEHLIVKLFYQYKKNGFVQITFENQIIYAWIKNIKQYICFNNPNNFNDPSGDTVKYNSFSDRVIVGLSSLTNSGFRQNFKDLKKSSETYIFKGYRASKGGGELTTDGKNLFITYNLNSSTDQGTNAFTNIRHETEHGAQFEFGEVGFDNHGTGNWEKSAVNFDAIDEYNAREAGYKGFVWNSDPDGNVRNSWMYGGNSKEEKIKHIQESDAYRGLPTGPINNSNTEKIKTSTQYMLPYRSRGYGKSIMEDYIVEIGIMESQIIIFDTIKSKVDFIDYDLPMFPYSYKYFMKNDTLFSYKIYGKWEYNKRKRTHEIQVDSIRLSKKEYVKLRKNKYIEIYIDYGTDTVCNMVKFKKKKNSKWFLENNEKWFQADYEVKRIFLKKYSSDGKKEKQTLKTK